MAPGKGEYFARVRLREWGRAVARVLMPELKLRPPKLHLAGADGSLLEKSKLLIRRELRHVLLDAFSLLARISQSKSRKRLSLLA